MRKNVVPNARGEANRRRCLEAGANAKLMEKVLASEDLCDAVFAHLRGNDFRAMRLVCRRWCDRLDDLPVGCFPVEKHAARILLYRHRLPILEDVKRRPNF